MGAVLIDSNVLLDVFENDPRWFEWSVDQLERCSESGVLIINFIVYAEVSVGFERIEQLEAQIRRAGLKLATIPREALFLAGKVFLRYRRRGGKKSSPLPDFFVGAHASVAQLPLLTRDRGLYKTYFPQVRLITPTE